jgi:hypothetical protein
MTSFLPGAAFIAALTITAPVWAQNLDVVTPITVQRPPPETAPGGTVVLRGSPHATGTSDLDLGYEPTDYQLVPPVRWGSNYGVDQSFDNNFDNNGFDRNFSQNGLTR